MSERPEMSIDPQPQQVPPTAVSVYGQDGGLDDFPVLKAFQQYIDAEQSKARKRLLTLCIFFGALMAGIVAVFVSLLISVNHQNQVLHDRMFEYAVRDRMSATPSAPVVVQPQQDSSPVLTLLASRLDELQKKMESKQSEQVKAAQEAKDLAEKESMAAVEDAVQGKRAAELEVKRLKALLESERETKKKARARQRQEEIEAYRRKYYPEFYTDNEEVEPEEENDENFEMPGINYWEDESDEVPAPKPTRKSPSSNKRKKSSDYTIPVDVRQTRTTWKIPND